MPQFPLYRVLRVEIDGTRYTVCPELELDKSLAEWILAGGASPDGTYILSSQSPPENLRGNSAGEAAWVGLLGMAAHVLGKIAERSTALNPSQFDLSQRAQALQPVISGKSALPRRGESTDRVDSDTDWGPQDVDSRYARAYAETYGVRFQSPPRSYQVSNPSVCTDTSPLPLRHRVILRQSETSLAYYVCNAMKRTWSPEVHAVVSDFLRTYQVLIRRAVKILAQNHPNLRRENVELFFDSLITTEFMYFNDIDLAQDIAAGAYAGISERYLDGLKARGPDTWKSTAVSTPFLGSRFWRFESWRRDIPIASQGLGPLQIIVGLAMEAARDKALLASYAPLVSGEDFKDEQAVIRAIFDPTKMFAAKAMTWDLELRDLEKTDPFFAPALLLNPDVPKLSAAREIGLLAAAQHLVQFPEQANVGSMMLATINIADTLSHLLPISSLTGVPLQVEGVQVLTRDSGSECPPTTFGSVEDQSDGSKLCLVSEPVQ